MAVLYEIQTVAAATTVNHGWKACSFLLYPIGVVTLLRV